MSEVLMQRWKRKINTITEAVELGELRLTEWEEGFIDSIGIQLENDKELSFKQSQHLNIIYDRVQ